MRRCTGYGVTPRVSSGYGEHGGAGGHSTGYGEHNMRNSSGYGEHGGGRFGGGVQESRHGPTSGSYGVAVSYKRGSPVAPRVSTGYGEHGGAGGRSCGRGTTRSD